MVHLVLGSPVSGLLCLAAGSALGVATLNRRTFVSSKDSREIILQARWNSEGTLLATVTANKSLNLYNSELSLLQIWKLPRTASSLLFSSDSRSIFVSDKAGDVRRYVISDAPNSSIVLGMLSSIMDMVFSDS